MCEDNVAELVITPDGIIKNIVFVEEFIAKAPQLPHWKFTALKPATSADISLQMHDYTFDKNTLSFYATEDENHPDDINITIVYDDFSEEDKEAVMNGVYIFLDNYLGELKFVTTIDNLDIKAKKEVEKELIPIEKLKDYLVWREKEFIEKYEGVRYNTENDTFSNLQAELPDGKPLFALIDSTLLNWEEKASHPWILEVIFQYDRQHESGLPDEGTDNLMNTIEDEIGESLKDTEGYLYVARETCNGERYLYFACADFRNPSKVLREITEKYAHQLKIDYAIYKDKYWHSFKRYQQN